RPRCWDWTFGPEHHPLRAAALRRSADGDGGPRPDDLEEEVRRCGIAREARVTLSAVVLQPMGGEELAVLQQQLGRLRPGLRFADRIAQDLAREPAAV